MRFPWDIELRRVLVVNDDSFAAGRIAQMLAALTGIDVAMTQDGRSALDALRMADKSFDLLISDLSVPDFEGIDFLRWVAAMGFTGQVILISGTIPSIVKAVESHCRHYRLRVLGNVQKPVQVADLMNLLRRTTPPVGKTIGSADSSIVQAGQCRI